MRGGGPLRALVHSALEHVASLGDDDLTVAVECSVRAGDHLRTGWEGGLEALMVQDKGVGDLVSAVDVLAEAAVLELLQSHVTTSRDLILSEETRATTQPEPGRRMWIVDPLDGTASYVFHTQPELVSVLVALYDCDMRRVTHAVELFPLGPNPRCVYARLGRGAFVNGQPLRVPQAVQVPLARAWVNLNHFSDVTFESDVVAGLRRSLRTPGTACRMLTTYPATSGVACQILLGDARLSVVVHDNHPRSVKQGDERAADRAFSLWLSRPCPGPWDTAAPQLIVEEAGGVFLDARTGLRYDTLRPEVVLIAATQQLADEIRALL